MSKKRTKKRKNIKKKKLIKNNYEKHEEKTITNSVQKEFKIVCEAFKRSDKSKLDGIQTMAYMALEANNPFQGYFILEQARSWNYSWGGDDLCPCGSGNTIFKCHLNNFKQRVNFSKSDYGDMRKTLKKNTNKECFIKGCKNDAIKSHVIPDNILKKIGLNILEANLFSENIRSSLTNPKLVGHKNISWKALCAQHDNNIYKNIDLIPFDLNHENIALFASKAALSEWSDKKTIYKNIRNAALKNTKLLNMPENINSLKEQPLGIRDIEINYLSMNNKNSFAAYLIIDLGYQFAGWTFSNITYNPFTMKKRISPNFIDDKEGYIQDIYPSISSICSPWGDKKMIFATVFSQDVFLEDIKDSIIKEWKLLEFIVWHLSEGNNLWQDNNENQEIINWILKKIKIPSKESGAPLGTQLNINGLPSLKTKEYIPKYFNENIKYNKKISDNIEIIREWEKNN